MSRLTSRVQHTRYGDAHSRYQNRGKRDGFIVLSIEMTPGFPTISAVPGNRPPPRVRG